MKRLKTIKYALISMLLAVFFTPFLALAENEAIKKLQNVGNVKGPYAEVGETSLSQMIGVIIAAALALIGSIFLILMLYAGYNWMTARGEEEKVTKAKDTITRAIIGLIIVVGAYAIWSFVFSNLIFNK
ncbi:hypothetical protein HY797_04380 [Candidatus Falkowbacteria bacterium]|nr:hypothetical protein [Candidatus Falkowbacteria bacterium]